MLEAERERQLLPTSGSLPKCLKWSVQGAEPGLKPGILLQGIGILTTMANNF